MKLRPKDVSPDIYAALLREDLAIFIERSFRELNPQTRYLPAGHIRVIAQMLVRVLRGEVKRLIINLPPRALKSHSVSVAFVAWALGHRPFWKVICASYGQELAEKFARDTRTIMQSPFYEQLFATRLSDRAAVHDFTTTRGGGRFTTSVGGALTGRGADCIIIDDPHKAEDALSPTRLTPVHEWYEHSLLSRLDSKEDGVIIVVAQRIHQSDLCGHLMEQGGWEVLSFPAIAEEDECFEIGDLLGKRYFRRKAGDPLHPERESLSTLQGLRASIGEFNFQAQYQQQPIPREGIHIKREWIQRYVPADLPEDFDIKLLSWDTASKAGERNDYSVCTIWGVHNRLIYLLDVIRGRFEFPELERRAIDLARLHPDATVLIEDRASGIELIHNLTYARIPGVIPFSPGAREDKEFRLLAQASLFQCGTVRLPESAPWLGEYEAELFGFPGAKFDDQVDSTSQALAHLRQALHKDVLPEIVLDLDALRRDEGWTWDPFGFR